MSVTTSINYEEIEKSYEGDVNIYISRTGSIQIHVIEEEGVTKKIFRADLIPLFTFMKQRLKNVDWGEISRTRDKKWGYKRLESDELFDILSNDRI